MRKIFEKSDKFQAAGFQHTQMYQEIYYSKVFFKDLAQSFTSSFFMNSTKKKETLEINNLEQRAEINTLMPGVNQKAKQT